MAAHKLNERRTAGIGDKLAAELHFADEFGRRHAGRGLGGIGDLDNLREADFPQGFEEFFASAGELVERGWRDERDRLAAFGQELQHGHEFGPLHDRAVGAGAEAFTAEGAFLEVDLGISLLVFPDRIDGAGGFAGNREPLDGVVEADVDETFAAFDAGFLIDERLAAHDVDRVVRADVDTGLGETVAAQALDDLDLGVGTARTRRACDRQRTFRPLGIGGHLVEIFMRETAVVLLVLGVEPEERHDPAGDDRAVVLDATVKRLGAGRLDVPGELVDRVAERTLFELNKLKFLCSAHGKIVSP